MVCTMSGRVYMARYRSSPLLRSYSKGYRIQRALASACTLCPFPEYSPVFQNTILIVSEDLDGCCSVSEDLDGCCSVSEGPDDYRMISRYRDK